MRDLWNFLEVVGYSNNHAWVTTGDFNEFFFGAHEKTSLTLSHPYCDEYLYSIEKSTFLPIDSIGTFYTWARRGLSLIMSPSLIGLLLFELCILLALYFLFGSCST